jgi:hypothetical protein
VWDRVDLFRIRKLAQFGRSRTLRASVSCKECDWVRRCRLRIGGRPSTGSSGWSGSPRRPRGAGARADTVRVTKTVFREVLVLILGRCAPQQHASESPCVSIPVVPPGSVLSSPLTARIDSTLVAEGSGSKGRNRQYHLRCRRCRASFITHQVGAATKTRAGPASRPWAI